MTTHYRYDGGQILHYEDGQLVDARALTPAEEPLGEALAAARKALDTANLIGGDWTLRKS